MPKIAFIGTGLLGSGMTEAAAKRGNDVTAWNRTPAKVRALEEFGVSAAPTPADAVRGAERVHLILKDDEVVDELIAALRPGLAPNATIIDHTTTRPDLTLARSTRLNSEGVRYLHCPVFMGPAAARANQGIVMASGPQHIYDDVKAELGRMGSRVEYLGERPDLAAVYKLCGNAFIIGIAALVADVFAVAGGNGIAPNDALRMLDFFNPSTIIAGRGKNMAAGNYAPSFELTMARKDLRLMIEAAGATEMISLPAIAARMDSLIAQGHGADDLGVIGKDAATSYTRRS
ncbi:MAG TPA: NAD(P)-dependent oxidoreductase [Gemmatimonadaceae bacterium]|nr:NAD(P)-dependent oxidoreductase [Gemmatimonadaceae bacterium]